MEHEEFCVLDLIPDAIVEVVEGKYIPATVPQVREALRYFGDNPECCIGHMLIWKLAVGEVFLAAETAAVLN